MFEYGKAVLVGPVVHYFGEYEDGDVLLPCRLWCKEVVTFLRTQNVSFFQSQEEAKNDETLDSHATRFKRLGHVFLPVL